MHFISYVSIMIFAVLANASSYVYRPHRWMKDFQHKRLDELVLPASHNSGAIDNIWKHEAFGALGNAMCQKKTIRQQLDSGIRYLDIRATSNSARNLGFLEHEVVCHNIAEFDYLRFAFDAVEAFLKENPSEVVVIHLSQEHGRPNDHNGIQMIANRYNRFFTHKSIKSTPIAEFGSRRIVLLSDLSGIKHGKSPSILLDSFWSDADHRKCHGDPVKMMKNIRSSGFLDGNKEKPKMKVFRWLKCEMHQPLKWVSEMAFKANPYVRSMVNKLTPGDHYFNVLSTDYVEDDIIKSIVMLNKFNMRDYGKTNTGNWMGLYCPETNMYVSMRKNKNVGLNSNGLYDGEEWVKVKTFTDDTASIFDGKHYLGVNEHGRVVKMTSPYYWKFTKYSDGDFAFKSHRGGWLSTSKRTNNDLILADNDKSNEWFTLVPVNP